MRRVLGVVLIVLAAMATVAFMVAPSRHELPAYVEQPVDLTQPNQPVALWIGDSYVAGTGASRPELAYPVAVSRQMGWFLNRDAQGGTGFVASGRSAAATNQPIPARLPATRRRLTANVVVVDGGRNDGPGVVPVERAYLDALVAAYPKARLVLVVPQFVLTTQPRPSAQQEIADDYRAFADTHPGTLVIDPLGWFGQDAVGYVRADRVHPNDVGHATYAKRFIAAIRAAHLDAVKAS